MSATRLLALCVLCCAVIGTNSQDASPHEGEPSPETPGSEPPTSAPVDTSARPDLASQLKIPDLSDSDTMLPILARVYDEGDLWDI
jgi:hypothetical protein